MDFTMLLYHFIDANYGLINILNRHLKVSRMSKLNDPYELRGVVAKEDQLKKGLENVRAYTEKTYGIICFSKTYSNTLLWSHYAEQHKGICLGFEINEENAVMIEYVRVPKILTESDLLGKNSKVKSSNILNTKHKNWSYEKEFRIFVRLEDCKKIDNDYFLDIESEFNLKEIILGHRCIIGKNSLHRALGDYSQTVTIYSSKMAEGKYRILREKYEH